MENGMRARPGTTIFCFAIALVEQLYLLREPLSRGFGNWPPVLYLELVSWVLLVAGIVISFVWKGWKTNAGCIVALALAGLHIAVDAVNFSTLRELYFAGINSVYPSYGPALVTLKLILILLGVTAGIPVADAPKGREYARKLEEAYHKQEMEWAKANMKGARKDAEETLAKLKRQLSQEELEALLASMREETSSADASTEETGENA